MPKPSRLFKRDQPSADVLPLSSAKLRSLQRECSSLAHIHDMAESGEVTTSNNHSFKFCYQNGLLYRKCTDSIVSNKIGHLALVVPGKCRRKILSTSHESTLSNHLGFRRTQRKIKSDFFWPGMSRDIRNFCSSCGLCQPLGSKGQVGKSLLPRSRQCSRGADWLNRAEGCN